MRKIDKFMKIFKEKDMIKGWLVGNFYPTCFSTDDFEVAIKRFKKGDSESSHHHKLATEITMIISGEVKMNDILYKKGDIVLMEPGESTDFLAIKKSVLLAIKSPCVPNDKYLN
jgi:quercetin dioxygenase-like cupin family protein